MQRINPFANNFPIREKEIYVGREGALEALFNDIINSEARNNRAFIAEKGSGKTSLINAVFFKRFQEKYNYNPYRILVYINFENYIGSITEFYETLYDELYNSVIKNDFVDDNVKKSIHVYDGSGRIKNILEDMLKILFSHGFRCIYFLDNLDKAAKKKDFTVAEFSYLRSLVNDDRGFELQYVITATKNLKDISTEAEVSGFDNIFEGGESTRFNPLFDEDEVEEYINVHFHDMYMNMDEDTIEDLIEIASDISGGNITILKKVANAAYAILERENFDEKYKFCKDELECMTIKNCDSYFEYLWNNCSQDEKNILLSLTSENEIDTDNYRIQDAFRAAESRSILKKKNENYYFISSAFKKYVEELKNSNKFNMVEVKSENIEEGSTEYYISTVIKKEFGAVNNTILSMQKKIDRINETVEHVSSAVSLNQEIEKLMKEITSSKTELTSEDIDLYVEKVGKILSDSDTNSMPQSISNKDFLDMWEMFNLDEKKEILLGEKLNSIFKNVNGTDLSTVSIVYCKFIEKIIYRTVFPWLVEFNPDYALNNGKTKLSESKYLMIGQAHYIIEYSELAHDIKHNFNSFGINYEKFARNLKKLTYIRNNSAHTGRLITREDINYLRHIMIESEDNLIKTLFKINSERIQSL